MADNKSPWGKAMEGAKTRQDSVSATAKYLAKNPKYAPHQYGNQTDSTFTTDPIQTEDEDSFYGNTGLGQVRSKTDGLHVNPKMRKLELDKANNYLNDNLDDLKKSEKSSNIVPSFVNKALDSTKAKDSVKSKPQQQNLAPAKETPAQKARREFQERKGRK